MKKIIAAFLFLFIASTCFAQRRVGVGVMAAYPQGAGISLSFDNLQDGNPMVYLLTPSIYQPDAFSLIFGFNVLFTLTDFRTRRVSMLSLGPALHMEITSHYDLAVLGVLRWEYNFTVPLNFYVDAGAGLATIRGIDFRWMVAIGIRYMFPL